jgi:hypothetical protein
LVLAGQSDHADEVARAERSGVGAGVFGDGFGTEDRTVDRTCPPVVVRGRVRDAGGGEERDRDDRAWHGQRVTELGAR